MSRKKIRKENIYFTELTETAFLYCLVSVHNKHQPGKKKKHSNKIKGVFEREQKEATCLFSPAPPLQNHVIYQMSINTVYL